MTTSIDHLLADAWKATPASMSVHLTRNEPPALRMEWPSHIDFISRRIASAVAGFSPKFICLSLPPQHAKSYTVSLWSIIWFLERFPHKRCILGGYSSDFAEMWGRRTRDRIEQYAGELTVRLNPQTNAAGEWETTHGGGMVATGVGGSITGRAGDGIMVVDDPYKDRAEAKSKKVRDNVWEWFTEVMLTRRAEDTVFVCIHTRWDCDDLIGRIQKKSQEGDEHFPKWDFINLKAIAEHDDPLGRLPGDALWPEKKSIGYLRGQKSLMGTWSFNALYQGEPTDAEGNFFKRSWMESPACQIDRQFLPPRHAMKLVRFWDLAATVEGDKGNADPDWTVGLLMGYAMGVAFVLDVVRFRASPMNVEARVKAVARQDGPLVKIRMQQDPGQAGRSQVLHYARLLAGYDFRGAPSQVDKVSRAGPFNAAMERGDVRIAKAPWAADLVDEYAAFPMGAHDDQVDAGAGAYEELTRNGQEWDEDSLKKAFSYGPAGQSGKPDPESDPMGYLRWRQAQGQQAGGTSEN